MDGDGTSEEELCSAHLDKLQARASFVVRAQTRPADRRTTAEEPARNSKHGGQSRSKTGVQERAKQRSSKVLVKEAMDGMNRVPCLPFLFREPLRASLSHRCASNRPVHRCLPPAGPPVRFG